MTGFRDLDFLGPLAALGELIGLDLTGFDDTAVLFPQEF